MTLRLAENIGSSGSDGLSARRGMVTFGLGGDDTITAAYDADWSMPWTTTAMGGPGNDRYKINYPLTLTIYDTSGTDAIQATGIGFTSVGSYTAIIDGRHLLLESTTSGQEVLILDWQTTGRIETFELADGTYSYDFIASHLTSASSFQGEYTWEDAFHYPVAFGYSTSEVDEAIQYYAAREATFVTPPLPPPPPADPTDTDGDFNGDGKADLFWRDDSGAAELWLMDGFTRQITATFSQVDPSWDTSGIGDFNGDGKTDLVWRQPTGAVAMWLMDGYTIADGTTFSTVDHSWLLRDTGDFNGDGRSDLLWEQDGGAIALWQMNGFDVNGGAVFTLTDSSTPVSLSTGWTILRGGDFNGDDRADILLRNNSTGDAQVWLMNGSTVLAQETISSADNSWKVADVADFNGDGKDDLVWRQQTGAVAMWLMDGTAVADGTTFSNVDASWTLADAADFTGDGKADLVWRQDSGAVAMWQLDGFTITAGTTFATQTGTWQAQPQIDIWS